MPTRIFPQNNRYPFCLASNSSEFRTFSSKVNNLRMKRTYLRRMEKDGETLRSENGNLGFYNFEFLRGILRSGIVLLAMVCGALVYGYKRALAIEGVMNAGHGVIGQSILLLRNAWPQTLQVLQVFKEQGIILAVLLGLSAFFSMAETAITTLWLWKVCELADKESKDGVFKMLRNDVTHFLITILIGTTVVNIGASALVTDAATAIFGEAGVRAATGVAILILTEITPKSIAVHNATEVARLGRWRGFHWYYTLSEELLRFCQWAF